MSPPPADAICPDPPAAGARAALRDPVAPRRVTDTPASRPGPAPCARRASRDLGCRLMNRPGYCPQVGSVVYSPPRASRKPRMVVSPSRILPLALLLALSGAMAVEIDGCAGSGAPYRGLQDPKRVDPEANFTIESVSPGSWMTLDLRDSTS